MHTYMYIICSYTFNERLSIYLNASFSWSDCGHTVHNGSSGQVISPNYPNNYNYHHNCSYIIWAPQRSHFHLNFLSFRVEDCGTCEGDWLEVINSCIMLINAGRE